MRALKRFLIIPVLAVASIFAFSTPSSAAQSAEILDITASNCAIYVTVEFGAPGTYRFQVWDDGTKLKDDLINIKGSGKGKNKYQVLTLVYPVYTPILQTASGIGLYIYDGAGATLYDSDGYFDFPGSDLCTV